MARDVHAPAAHGARAIAPVERSNERSLGRSRPKSEILIHHFDQGALTPPPPIHAQEIHMPALSPTMTHGGILSWDVEEGGAVRAGDSLAQIETDKATMAHESQEDGFLAKICGESDSDRFPYDPARALNAVS